MSHDPESKGRYVDTFKN